MKMSRGLRNNNPGNIRLGNFRYKGERATSSDSAFRQFESVEWSGATERCLYCCTPTPQSEVAAPCVR